MGRIPTWLREQRQIARLRQFGLTLLGLAAITVVMAPLAAAAGHRARHMARSAHATTHRDATPSPVTPPSVTPDGIVLPGDTPAGLAATSDFNECQIIAAYSPLMCGWKDVGYNGTMWFWCKSGGQCGNGMAEDNWNFITAPNNQNAGAQDQISSWYNDRNASTYVAKDYPPTNGYQLCITAYAVNSDLTSRYWPSGGEVNDTVSGINLRSTHPC